MNALLEEKMTKTTVKPFYDARPTINVGPCSLECGFDASKQDICFNNNNVHTIFNKRTLTTTLK